MSAPFLLTPEANVDHTGLAGAVALPPRSLVSRFGPPLDGEGFKSSGSYSFTSAEGEVFTLYDWKATSLYYEGEKDPALANLPSPAVFWSSSLPFEFKVGARRGSKGKSQFCEWLLAEVAS